MGQSAEAQHNDGRALQRQTSVPPWQQWAAWSGLSLLLVLLLIRYVVLIRPRAMEFDQICTLLTAMAPSWHAYLAAVPADSQPPFSHIAARIGMLLPLPQFLGLHLVSALAVVFAAVCLFRLFQRRGAPIAGLCSAALFVSSRCVEYMFTLRPYAALLSISAASLLAYDVYRTRRANGTRATLWPLSLLIVVAATIHALTIVYVMLPIVFGELLYWYRERRLDGRLLSAVGLAATAFLFDFVLAHQIQRLYMNGVPLSARVPGLPTLAKLREVLTTPVERHWQALLLATVVAVTCVLWLRSRRGTAATELPRGERVDEYFPIFASASLYVAGVVAFCAGAMNHYFFPRYASPVFLCGPLLLGGMLALKPWRRYTQVALILAVVLFMLPLPALRIALKQEAAHSPRDGYDAIFSHGDIIASPLAFPTLWWYATPQERSRMRVIAGGDRYRTLPDGIPEAVLQRFEAAGVLPFSLTPLQDFAPGQDVYLVTPVISGDTWLPDALRPEGFTCAADARFHAEAYAMLHCVRQPAE